MTTDSSSSALDPQPLAEDPAVPYFPAPSPAVMADPDGALALILPTLAALAEVVDLPEASLGATTPCEDFTAEHLRDHVVGWLQFFAAALNDPDGTGERPDPVAYRAATDPVVAAAGVADVVRTAARRIESAVTGAGLGRTVVVSASRMDAPAVLAMMLGEYLVHGWDLARTLSRPWTPSARASEVAREFFAGMITDDYRGGPDGYFGPEVVVPDEASAFDRLLGFAGRDPAWSPQR